MTALARSLVLMIGLAFARGGLGGEWHVATNGTAAATGSRGSPWDIESALGGAQRVAAGDTIWLHRGIYRRPFENVGLGWPVRLVGSSNAPVHVRPWRGERVTIDGGLNVQSPSSGLWIWDLEIMVSDPWPAAPLPHDPTYQNLNRPWGGLNISSGDACKFINLIVHDNAQGVSWWAGSTRSELHGCIIYDNGWQGTVRGHGHAIYTQNRDGVKAITDCLLTGGFGYTVHAYGSSRAFVDQYRVEGNIAYEGGPFLIGGGRPSRDIRVLTNLFYGVPLQLGYQGTTNVDCELRGNLLVNARLTINRFARVIEQDNSLLGTLEPRPQGSRLWLRPNRYDPQRAHLAILNWERVPTVAVEVSSFLRPGDRFRVLRPTDFYGEPVLAGIARGDPIELPAPTEFTVYVLLRR